MNFKSLPSIPYKRFKIVRCEHEHGLEEVKNVKNVKL